MNFLGFRGWICVMMGIVCLIKLFCIYVYGNFSIKCRRTSITPSFEVRFRNFEVRFRNFEVIFEILRLDSEF